MAAFPTLEALAAARERDVLKLWAGLGYYARGRALLRTAQVVVEEHDGAFPSTEEGLRALPGVGAYTAGAIASIVFDKPVAAVDGNVVRVVSRWLALGGDVHAGPGRKHIEDVMRGLLQKSRPSVFTQAVMELGARVCTKKPACASCPVRSGCRAYQAGSPTKYPRPKKQPSVKAQKLTALVLTHRGKVLFGVRPSRGLYGGLREPPILPAAEARRWLASVGMTEADCQPVGNVIHILTHRRLGVRVLSVSWQTAQGKPHPPAPYVKLGWLAPKSVKDRSALADKVLALIPAPGRRLTKALRGGMNKA